MIGNTFIHEPDRDRLATIGDVDDLDGLTTVELDTLMSIDFELMTSEAGLHWSEGEPVLYDLEGGLAVFKVSPEGMKLVLSRESELDECQRADVRRGVGA